MYLLLIIRVIIITLEIKFVLFMLTFLPVSQTGGSSCVAAAGSAAANWRQRRGGGWLWPAACTCCRKNNSFVFPSNSLCSSALRLCSVVIPPSSGCAGLGGAGRQCRCDPPEICLELRPQDGWRCSLPPSAGPAALLSRCPLPVSASRDPRW